MKRILLDTNVVLDVLLDRKPHVAASAAVWTAVESRQVEGLLAAHAITTIHYLIRRELGATRAHRTISTLLQVFSVAPVNQAVVHEALSLNMPDFEDAVTAAAARVSACQLVVTRDPRGFRTSPVRSMLPEAALPLLHR